MTETFQISGGRKESEHEVSTNRICCQHEHADDELISISMCALGRSIATGLCLNQQGS